MLGNNDDDCVNAIFNDFKELTFGLCYGVFINGWIPTGAALLASIFAIPYGSNTTYYNNNTGIVEVWSVRPGLYQSAIVTLVLNTTTNTNASGSTTITPSSTYTSSISASNATQVYIQHVSEYATSVSRIQMLPITHGTSVPPTNIWFTTYDGLLWYK